MLNFLVEHRILLVLQCELNSDESGGKEARFFEGVGVPTQYLDTFIV